MYTYTFKIDTNYFSPNFHWIPKVPSKSLRFYFTIIFQIRSVTIKPIFDKTDSTKIIFHSAHILNAVTEEDWGIHPHTSKKYHKQKLLTATMIILILGSNSCYLKPQSNLNLNSLILTKNAIRLSHFGFNVGGIKLDLFLKYFSLSP